MHTSTNTTAIHSATSKSTLGNHCNPSNEVQFPHSEERRSTHTDTREKTPNHSSSPTPQDHLTCPESYERMQGHMTFTSTPPASFLLKCLHISHHIQAFHSWSTGKKKKKIKKEKKNRKGAILYGKRWDDYAMRCANICGGACDASTSSGTVHNVTSTT